MSFCCEGAPGAKVVNSSSREICSGYLESTQDLGKFNKQLCC